MDTKPKIFKTNAIGTGPFCVQFSDGEIVFTRSAKRQRLIAFSQEMLDELKEIVSFTRVEKCKLREIELKSISRLIAKTEGR